MPRKRLRKNTSRRRLLVTGSAAAVIIGLGGVTGYAYWPGLKQAREPWREAGQSFGDPRLDALAYAILAPNAHNRQPWMFELVGQNRIDIYCDLEKRLPETDPFDRQTTIGFGCMLELLSQAAAHKGHRVQIKNFPDGEPFPSLDQRRIAEVVFEQDTRAEAGPLFSAIMRRHSNKEPYDTSRFVAPEYVDRIIEQSLIEPAKILIGGTVEKDQTARITDMAWKGWLVEYETPRTRWESVDLMRIGNRAIAENPDGIDLGGIPMGLMKIFGMMNKSEVNTPGSQAYDTGIQIYDETINSAMGYMWVISDENTRHAQLLAGQNWVRMNLAAEQQGLSIHPLSQILQEYPEMSELYQDIHRELGVTGDRVIQMLARIGYGPLVEPSPRWPVQSKIIAS